FIGSGAFGTVYRGLWGERDVALKVLNLPTSQVDEEASHLCRLSHNNVIQFFGVCELPEQNSPALVMEFAFGGPLNAVLRHHPVLSPSTLLTWSIQIATGMAYLHSDAKLVHRDLKSANREFLYVLAGFSFKSDVWSYGVVLWELLTLELPFRTMEQPRLMYIIAMYNYTLHIPSDVPEMFSQLLRDCWSPEPDNRPSFEDIIGRLKLAGYCNFTNMDADELSRIQAGWRESIQAHHQAEQEVCPCIYVALFLLYLRNSNAHAHVLF
ncbi:Mitogen-activated protein kinase kinase kinase 10, partial [Fasciolopsis buskii]